MELSIEYYSISTSFIGIFLLLVCLNVGNRELVFKDYINCLNGNVQ